MCVCWREAVQEEASTAAQVVALRRAAGHILHQLLSAAVGSWMSATLGALGAKESIGHALLHLLHRGLSVAFSSWVQASSSQAASAWLQRRALGRLVHVEASAALRQ